MILAITSTGNNLKSLVSPSFGRSPYFVFVEVENNEIKKFEAVVNPASQAFRGAGIVAAQEIVRRGASVVITGNVGPNSFGVLSQSGVKIYITPSTTVEEAVKMFLNGKLAEFKAGFAPGFRRGFGRGRRWRW